MKADIVLELDDKAAKAALRKTESNFKKSIARMKKIATSLADSFKRAFKRMVSIAKTGAKIIVLSFLAISIAAIKVASDAQEIGSKFDTVFKDLADGSRKWAREFGDSVGRATQDVQNWMAGLQDTFVPLGFARDKAAELSKSLVALAVDVASFNNAADKDVIRDFNSALVGNHETVRKFGIIISEATLVQEALATGINKTASELTDLEKVQLRYNLILKGTSDAQGDAVRTGGSFANQLKRLMANMKEVLKAIGDIYIPIVTAGLVKINDFIQSNIKSIDEFSKKIKEVLTFNIETRGLGDTLKKLVKVLFKAVGIQTVAWVKGIANLLIPLFEKLGNILSQSLNPFSKRNKLLKEKSIIISNLKKLKDDSLQVAIDQIHELEAKQKARKELAARQGQPRRGRGALLLTPRIPRIDPAVDDRIASLKFFAVAHFEAIQSGNAELIAVFDKRVAEGISFHKEAIDKLNKELEGLTPITFDASGEMEKFKVSLKEATKESVALFDVFKPAHVFGEEKKEAVDYLDIIKNLNKEMDSLAKAGESFKPFAFGDPQPIVSPRKRSAAQPSRAMLGKSLAEGSKKRRDILRAERDARSKELQKLQSLRDIFIDLRDTAGEFSTVQKLITKQAELHIGLGIEKELVDRWKELQINIAKVNASGILTGLRDSIGSVTDSTSNFFETWIDGSKSMKDAFKDLAGNIKQIFTRMISDLIAKWVIFQVVTGLAGRTFGLTNPLAGTPQLPQLARGGITNGPSIAGEGNSREAVVPLPDGRTIPVKLSGGNGDVVVNVINQSSQEVTAEIGTSFFEFGQLVTEVILKDFNSNGPVVNNMRSEMRRQ